MVGTNHGLHARVRRLSEPVLRLACADEAGGRVGPVDFPIDPAVLLEGAPRELPGTAAPGKAAAVAALASQA